MIIQRLKVILVTVVSVINVFSASAVITGNTDKHPVTRCSFHFHSTMSTYHRDLCD